ncbi:hypothetical protein D3C85_1585840 [compost metagenome]
MLIHEATKARGSVNSHTSLEELLTFYPLERIEQIYAVHLTDGESYSQVLSENPPAVSSKVTLAQDMMKVSV